MSRFDRTVKSLSGTIKNSNQRKTSPFDVSAEVLRIEGNIAWVHIPGGVDETPVRLTVNAKVGDTVQVRGRGGRAWITGNATAPPTDDTAANEAKNGIKLINKAVKVINSAVDKVARIAGNTAQYFWHTETGTDTGVHITEIPKDEFLEDPTNGGGNLLARSNGIAVRDGLDELATFDSNGVALFKDGNEVAEFGEDIALYDADTGDTMLGFDSDMGYMVTKYGYAVGNGSFNNGPVYNNDGFRVYNVDKVLGSVTAHGIKGFNIKAGRIDNVSVPANSYVDYTVNYSNGSLVGYTAFEHNPIIVATFISDSGAAEFGRCTLSVHSATTTSAKIRVFNGSSATRTPSISWIAMDV